MPLVCVRAEIPMKSSRPTSTPHQRHRINDDWRERAGRLYSALRSPAAAMIHQAYPGLVHDDDFDDIYDSAWVRTLRSLEDRHAEFNDHDVRNYIFTAMANAASNEYRRRKRKPVESLDVGTSEVIADWHGSVPEDRVWVAEEMAIARDVVSSLPPRRRSVMLLRYGWGLKPEQVCERISGLSPRAYRHEISRGVEQLAKCMKSFENGELCAERAAALRDFASGLASKDQKIQVKNHLGHCRKCAAHVAELKRSLKGLKAVMPAPLGLDLFFGGSRNDSSILSSTVERLRDGVAHLSDSLGGIASRLRGGESLVPGNAEATAQAAGIGAVSTGALATLGAGKIAVGCIASIGACAAIGLAGNAVVNTSQGEPDPVKAGLMEDAIASPELSELPVEPYVAVEEDGQVDSDPDSTDPARRQVSGEEPMNEFDVVERAAEVAAPAPPTASRPASGNEVAKEFGLP